MTHRQADKDLDLIASLSASLVPVTPMRPPYLRALGWGAGALLYVLGAGCALGFRSDLADMLARPGFVFELSLASMIALSSGAASMFLSLPDQGGVRWAPLVPAVMTAVFLVWALCRACFEDVGLFEAHHPLHCMADSLLMVCVPMAALVAMGRSGRTTMPCMLMAMNVLAVSALGWMGLHLTCPVDTVGHAFIVHFLPFVGAGILFGALARRVYSW